MTKKNGEKTMYRIPASYGNANRLIGTEAVEEITVSVGKKYFTDSTNHKYYMESVIDYNGNECYLEHCPMYSPDYVLYKNKAFAHDELERRVLRIEVARTFDAYTMNLEQLKKVKEIMQTR